MLLGGGAMAYLTQLTVTSSYAVSIAPALVVMGLGFGMIFSPAINTATAGVARRDSGVASALVNTMQQVGGSIGTAALSTVALTTTATYLAAHHAAGPLAQATAAVHGYTAAFAVSAALFGIGALVAVLLTALPAPAEELRNVEPTASAVLAASPALTDSVSADVGPGPSFYGLSQVTASRALPGRLRRGGRSRLAADAAVAG